jgi:hypothetical protein
MRYVLGLGIMSALLFSAMAVYTSSLEPGIPSIQLTFTEFAFNSILNQWTASQIEIFKRHFLIDYPFLVCYGSLGYLMANRTALFAGFSRTAVNRLAICLPVAATADGVENSLHLIVIFGAAPSSQALYFAAGAAASAKWLLILAFVVSATLALLKKAR